MEPYRSQPFRGGLEQESQGHLNLARGTYGFVYDAESRGRVIEWLTFHGEIIVELVLGDIVDRDIEAGSVGLIEDVEGIFHSIAFGEFSQFHKGNVSLPLPRLAEDVALSVGEVGLEGVACRNRPVEIPGT